MPIMVREFSAEDSDTKMRVFEAEKYLAPVAHDVPEYPPARVSPSGITPQDGELLNVVVKMVVDFGRRIDIKGSPDLASLGSAVHGFLGVDHSRVPALRQHDIAAGLLWRWGVEDSVSPADLPAAGERLQSFIENNYPGAKVHCEWPITLRNAERQLMHGWIDMLLELPEGYVVVDHKTYPGADAQEHASSMHRSFQLIRRQLRKRLAKM